jgi:excinuclease UvrABC ATPase subunit
MTTYRRQRKAPPPLWAFVAIPFGLFGILFVVNLFNEDFQRNSRRMNQTVQNEVHAEMELAHAQSEAKRAESRFRSPAGCKHVPSEVAEIQLGMKFNLPEGTDICSEDGTTAEIDENGLVIDIARTANMDVIREWGGW